MSHSPASSRTVLPAALGACAIALLVLQGCAGGGSSPAAASSPSATVPAGPSAPISAPIFDPARLHEVRLEIDPADWAALRDEYWSNQYYAANVTLDGQAVAQVGVRSRGSGSRSPTKPSFKLDFNRYVAKQEYAGYKSLVLDNSIQDPTYLRDKLALQVFEAMGIPGPQSSFGRVTVNGEPWGLYQLTEPVSKPFLQSRLGEDGGNLFDYQYSSAWDFSYLGGRPERYIPSPFQPETNEDSLDPNDLVDFIAAINETPDEGYETEMSRWMDVNRFATYLAVENAIAEADGFAGELGANNFYLYQYAGQRRFVLIPWDKDSTFRAAHWDAYQGVDTNVLSHRLLAVPSVRQRYVTELRRAATSYVNGSWLGPRLETAYGIIRAAALADPKKPYTNDDFEASVVALRATIAAREADVVAQVGR